MAARFTSVQNSEAQGGRKPGVGATGPRIIATAIHTAADDFVIDIYHNGERVPDAQRKVTAEIFGAMGEKIEITVREGDWLVFNVVNNRLRWNGAYYFAVGAVNADDSIGFVSELESGRWSACDNPGGAPRFIRSATTWLIDACMR